MTLTADRLVYDPKPKLTSDAAQIILANVVQLNAQISQGSVTTDLRRGTHINENLTFPVYIYCK